MTSLVLGSLLYLIFFFQEPDEILREDLLQLEYGNKIAILGGDYLLANACTGLADLRNTYIVEMISIAIAEFTQVLLQQVLFSFQIEATVTSTF